LGVSVTTAALTRRLTRREHVQREIPGAESVLLDALIDGASAAIEAYCNRPFGREALTETLAGYGGPELQLARTPVIAVSSVQRDLDVLTDHSIESRDQGTLYRRAGWDWNVQAIAGFAGRQRFPGFGVPLPGTEEPRFSVSYVAGYILPEQSLEGGTVSVEAADNSFNAAGGGFPGLLRAGDILVASGFASSVNNGRFIVSGTPTAAKAVVTSPFPLVDEAAAAGKVVSFDPPADCRPFASVERAAIEAVKSWYLRASEDPDVVEKQVGDLRMRWSGSEEVSLLPLPAVCVGLLRPWVRAV
jgi:hypothetical protein